MRMRLGVVVGVDFVEGFGYRLLVQSYFCFVVRLGYKFAFFLVLVHFVNDMMNFLLFFSLLVDNPENEVHGDNLICDDDRNIENGIVLGLLLQIAYEFDDESAVVDDFSKQDDFESD